VKGFGCELHGQEEAGGQLARYVDEKFTLKHAGLPTVKEDFMQPVCAHGVGCGKSALLDHGLFLHKKHCQNKDLLEMLKDENHPLAIHITFSSDTPFDAYESNIQLALIRRILAACLGLDWLPVARSLPLSESLQVADCLYALVAYQKTLHNLQDDEKLFVYLAVDEINMLVRYPSGGDKADITSLKALAKSLQGLSISNGFISTLFAGTHYADMKDSFVGSGIRTLDLKINRLSDQAIEVMLRTDAQVNKKYIKDPTFQQLLRDIGPLMRAIGIAISNLEYEYDARSIARARSAVVNYLGAIRQRQMSEADRLALCGLVLTGGLVSPKSLLSEGSVITLDSLQNSGTVVLLPSQHVQNAQKYSVFMSRLMLEAYLHVDPNHAVAAAAIRLLEYIDTRGPDSFEKFVAHYHSLRKAILLGRSKAQSPIDRVPSTAFFPGALIGDGLLKQEQRLKAATVSLNYPDGVMLWQGHPYPDTAETDSVNDHLKNGGVVLNSKEAAADVIICENVCDSDSSDWQEGVTVYAVKHTIVGKKRLTAADVKADNDKAMNVFRNSKNHSKALLTVVHFSNRELAKGLQDVSTWKPEWQRSVVIGRSNIESVVGTMFGRMLTSKGFCGVGGRTRAKPFSTLARAMPVGRLYQGTMITVVWMNRLFR
jgi:hypothetical protein